MLKYPFNVASNVDIKTLISTPYIAGVHPGTDFRLNNKTALIAVSEGRVTLSNSIETRNWLANTQSDPFLNADQKLQIRNTGKPQRALTTSDYGKFIKIDHGKDAMGNAIYTLLAHMESVEVPVGDRVVQGQLIGYSDNTGNSTGPHLHYEIRKNDRVIDPDTMDYSFEGAQLPEAKLYPYKELISVIVDDLAVRVGPATNQPLSKNTLSQRLKKGDTFQVVGFVMGEEVQGNNLWWLTWRGNYVWTGGTIKPVVLNDYLKGGSNMSDEPMVSKESLMAQIADLEKLNNDYSTQAMKLKEDQSANDAKLTQLRETLKNLPIDDKPTDPVNVASPIIDGTTSEEQPTPPKLTEDQKTASEQLKVLDAKIAEIEDLKKLIKERVGL